MGARSALLLARIRTQRQYARRYDSHRANEQAAIRLRRIRQKREAARSLRIEMTKLRLVIVVVRTLDTSNTAIAFRTRFWQCDRVQVASRFISTPDRRHRNDEISHHPRRGFPGIYGATGRWVGIAEGHSRSIRRRSSMSFQSTSRARSKSSVTFGKRQPSARSSAS